MSRTPFKATLVAAAILSFQIGPVASAEPAKKPSDLPEILLWDEAAQNAPSSGEDTTAIPLDTRIGPLPKNGAIVVKFDPRCVAGVKFTETARNSVLDDDLAALAKKALRPAGDLGKCETDLRKRQLLGVSRHVPKFDRSTIKATAVDKDGKELGGVTIYYGPPEHLHLAIDLPVTNRKTLKYDEASGTLQPKEEKPQVYLSLNYRIGDLLEEPRTIADRVEVKLLVLASRKPLDSYGIGLGIKLDDMKPLKLDLKGLSIFGGYFRTKVDTIVDGVARPDEGTKNSWRVGISYDLSAGLKWASF